MVSRVQCYTCKMYGHKMAQCNSKSRAMSSRIQGVPKRNSEVVGAMGRGSAPKQQKRVEKEEGKKGEPERDEEGFSKVVGKGKRKERTPISNRRIGPKVIFQIPEPRITEVEEDPIVCDWNPHTPKYAMKNSDWSAEESDQAGPSLF